MKKDPKKIITVLLFLLVAGWGIKLVINKAVAPPMRFQQEALTTIDSSLTISINDFNGTVLIVSCYQSWCIDCARETPVLNQLAADLNSDRFKIIYISDEGKEKQKAFRNRFPADKILFTQSQKSLASLGIHVYPTTFLLNKNGEVITTKLEGYDWSAKKEAIKELIDE